MRRWAEKMYAGPLSTADNVPVRSTAPADAGSERATAAPRSSLHSACTAVLFRDVEEHIKRVARRVEGLRDVLRSVFDRAVGGAAATKRGNVEAGRLGCHSGDTDGHRWYYGMNFENMPDLKLRYGYYIVLAVTASICGLLTSVSSEAIGSDGLSGRGRGGWCTRSGPCSRTEVNPRRPRAEPASRPRRSYRNFLAVRQDRAETVQ